MLTTGYFGKVPVDILFDLDWISMARGDIPIFLMIFSTFLTTSSIILTYMPPTKTRKQLSVGVVMALSYLMLFFRLIVSMGKSSIFCFVPKFIVKHFPTF